MNNIFGNQSTEGMSGEQDRLGSGGVLESGIYDGIIKAAYAGKAQNSQAMSVTINAQLTLPSGSTFDYRETIWVTNRTNENFYVDKKDATKKHLLPGFLMVDSICLMSTGQGLTDQDMEEKVFNIYDFDQKAEVPKSVPTLVDLIGKPITLAILKQIVDKNVKQADGSYKPGGETREENVIDKAFHTDSKRTTSEVRAGLEDALFYSQWDAKNTGKTRNRAKGGEGKTGSPANSNAASRTKTSLFS